MSGTPPRAADLLLVGRVVTMNATRLVIPDGAIAVRDGRIVAVGPRDEVEAAWEAPRRIARPHAILLPGLADCHTHVTQALVRGLVAHELPMIYRIYTPATRAMTLEEAETAAQLCAAQLLLSGVTTICEGAVGQGDAQLETVIGALVATGIRINVVTGRPDQDFHHAALYSQAQDRSWRKQRDGEAEADLARTEALLERYPPGGSGQVSAGVCASSLTNYSEHYVRLAAELATRHGAKLHIHAARDREEVEYCLAVSGRRPIERLADLGAVNERLVVAHAMLATEHEIRLLGQGRAGVAHSAIEVLNILNAVPNVRAMREQGVTVGLGCDNAANDMFSTMRAAWAIHTATRGMAAYDPEVLDAMAVLEMATIDAAKLLGLDAVTGSIEVGKAADLVVLDGAGPHLRPIQDLVPEIVRYACRADVREVVVAGRIVVEDGRLTTLDLEALLSRAEVGARRLRGFAAGGRYRSLCCPEHA